ncbi:MAG: translation factor GTPase family protein, partial [Lachnospiraceae bacterium]|nr:translation factor GTPase family protein [Lachnospiraceae bacterium]
MKHAVIGILAHVDAGKTTLSEDLLFRTGAIRKKGSVDSGDTVMDSNAIEADRGITIYSSEAVIRTDAMELQLIDTPGHVDFSGEAERALSVLDCAILVLSGSEGVQSHTRTLWDLLRRHHIPTFIFVNKMDIAHESASDLLRQMKTELSDGITDFTDLFRSGRGGEASGSRKTEEYLSGELAEELASCHEDLLNEYMETETLKKASVTEIIGEGLIFPTIFGSARNSQGTKELLSILEEYMPVRKWPEEFGALCYKVDRDQKGNRLTYLKVTGGLLKARMEIGDEKINEIRTYVGERYETRQEVPAGELCAVTGLSESYSGQGLGIQEDQNSHELEPVFRYRVLPEGGVSSHTLLQALKELEEEDPLLDVAWDQKSDEIRISLMGPIQKEILATELRDKYQIEASFAESKVTYRETLRQPVEGHGHFEPLRHFADVWLRMEPLPAGSGISAVSECSTDELEENYQRQILRRLLSGRQTGVRINADLTDVRFVLTHGKSHTKHTEGGDFRTAT